jgi:hypothetical protein
MPNLINAEDESIVEQIERTSTEQRNATKGEVMSAWTKEQLEQMLEDVINELDLSDIAIEQHGPMGTPPAELVRLVLDQKDKTIRMLKANMVEIRPKGDFDGWRCLTMLLG